MRLVLIAQLAAVAALLAACGAKTDLDRPPPCLSDADCPEFERFCGAVPVCIAGVCGFGDPRDCDDDGLCTIDTCDEASRTCSNAVRDFDGDGALDGSCGGDDCDDADPRVFPGAPELCADRRDNDCDGRTDCSDADCRAFPDCAMCAPELCTNGDDDDCDEAIDCADSDCATDPSCCREREVSCDDALDDDCDGAIDCLDDDCRAAPTCCAPRAELCNGDDDDCDGVVDDGATCFFLDGAPLEPLRISSCAAAWYAYDDPDSASANPVPDIRSSDAVTVAVVSGPASCGGAAIAIIADQTDDGSGGELSARFELTPRTVRGVLLSDEADECTYDAASGIGRCDWRWQPCCTDGALLGAFPGDFCATLTLSAASGVASVGVHDGSGARRPLGFDRAFEICARTLPAVP